MSNNGVIMEYIEQENEMKQGLSQNTCKRCRTIFENEIWQPFCKSCDEKHCCHHDIPKMNGICGECELEDFIMKCDGIIDL